jgi:hypothetical protein
MAILTPEEWLKKIDSKASIASLLEAYHRYASVKDIICLSPVDYEREHQIKLINELTSSDQFPFQRLNALLGLATAYKDAMTAKPMERSQEYGC